MNAKVQHVFYIFQIKTAKRSILVQGLGPGEGGPGHVQDTGNTVVGVAEMLGLCACAITSKLNVLNV